MEVFHKASLLIQHIAEKKAQGQQIGFVPTMGALHEGHLSLIRASKAENTVTVASIYVNPTQFDNKSDLARYPRTLGSDCELLEKEGCDVVFAPSDEEMYPNKQGNVVISMHFGALEQVMEGKYRKGHFSGVGLVVSKLFHIVQPHRAYFGQKDLQQFAIIKQLVDDLSFNVQLKRCPIIREQDGLAMSSRNRLLSDRERFVASKLHESLTLAKQMLIKGVSLNEVKDAAIAEICKHKDFKIEYLEVVDADTLQAINDSDERKEVAICVAAHLGSVRLIDNMIIH
ncbi:MAG: pantoate--beta-alanine ligase [Flammeovirgaceae bacterium]